MEGGSLYRSRYGQVWSEPWQLKMMREQERLLTYSRWPHNNPMQPQKLAAAGFYFIGPDYVKCAFCCGTIHVLLTSDIPMVEHANYYPDCPFVIGAFTYKGRNAGNVPLEDEAVHMPSFVSLGSESHTLKDLGIVTGKPRHPLYATEFQRMETFRGFPTNCPVSPVALAAAGFFYTGRADCVRCFYCDLGLRMWVDGDDPWDEHIHWNPQCYFRSVQEKPASALVRAAQSSEGSSAISSSSHSLTWLNKEMDNKNVKIALEMGYPRQLISAVLQEQYANQGIGFDDVCGLLEAIFLKEREGGVTETPTPTVEENPVQKPEESADTQESHMSLKEENRQLKERCVCKVCLVNEVKVVFLPCGHIASCFSCSLAMKDCVICRSPISGTARIFLA